MLKSIRVRNFKAIKDSTTLELARINVLVGKNNSGKSSLLHALAALKQTMQDPGRESPLVTSGEEAIVDLGGWLDIVHGHTASRKIGVHLEFEQGALGSKKLSLHHKKKRRIVGITGLSLEFQYSVNTRSIDVSLAELLASDGSRILAITGGEKCSVVDGMPKGLGRYLQGSFSSFVPMVTTRTKAPPRDSKLRDQAFEMLNHFGLWLIVAVERAFSKLGYVSPIRREVPWVSRVGKVPPSQMGPTGSNIVKVLASRRKSPITKRTAIEDLNYWLGEKFNIVRNVRLQPVDEQGTYVSLVADDIGGQERINFNAMGAGVSQLAPVVVATGSTPRGGCLIVEQPELHLHPAGQADLADLFIESMSGDRQFIIETHSEHFVLRLRRRIAEGVLDPTDVALFVVEHKKGSAVFHKHTMDTEGSFVDWPHGFFDGGLQEAMAISSAKLSRKQRDR